VFPRYSQSDPIRELLSFYLVRNTDIQSLGRSGVLSSEVQTIQLEDFVGHSMQVWIVASTIIATALFGLMLWNNRRAVLPIRSIRLDGILLLTWWIALLGVCAYGFMLGMGG
jgi:hypothetical protein